MHINSPSGAQFLKNSEDLLIRMFISEEFDPSSRITVLIPSL